MNGAQLKEKSEGIIAHYMNRDADAMQRVKEQRHLAQHLNRGTDRVLLVGRRVFTKAEIIAALKNNGWADDGEGGLFKTIGRFRKRITFNKTSLNVWFKMPWHTKWQSLYLVGFDHVGLTGEFSGVKWWV